jgi:hypothetical protein
MTSEEKTLLESRKAGFDAFYKELIPVLVDFVGKMGIGPAHEVLNNAVQFAPYLDKALGNLAIEDEQDRIWLLTRLGYFIGEYFCQKYKGCWYVNEIQGSRYFGRYVVGQFAGLSNAALMLDPFHIAQAYVEEQTPRHLDKLLTEVDAELVAVRQ